MTDIANEIMLCIDGAFVDELSNQTSDKVDPWGLIWIRIGNEIGTFISGEQLRDIDPSYFTVA